MKKLLIALIGISTMLLGSCSQEWGGHEEESIASNTLRLTVNVENKGSVSTRVSADKEIGEETITSLHLLFFESSADRSGEFVDFVSIKDLQGVEIKHDIDMTNTLLNVTAAYNILAIANIDDHGTVRYLDKTSVDGWMQQWAGKTEKDVIKEAQAWVTAGVIDPSGLLMSGSTTKAANSFTVDLTLVRNQIRFDVVNNATDYVLKSVEIYNAYSKSKIWNDGTDDGALDYSDEVSRIKEYYGFEGTEFSKRMVKRDEDTDPYAIHGHFYVFENQVTMPVQNDEITTCLILGLDDGSGIRYYRVNIAPDNQAQILYRNYAYILTINSVLGQGHQFRGDAYNDPNNDKLNYVINQWNDVEVGVADQDNNSMLSSPYKTVNIDLFTGEIKGRSARGLSPNSFDITAVTSLPVGSYTTLDIIGTPEFHLNGSDDIYDGITVNLDKSTGTLEFNPVEVALPAGSTETPGPHNLQSGDKITGSVTLGFAGLRVTIDVVQTDLDKLFLNLFLPEGGIPRFAPFGGIESDNVRVEASGAWSARILSETPGVFGFVGTSALEINKPLEDKEFAVRTVSANTDSRKAREAFVVITLDDDPLNYSKVVRLTQQQKAEIAISPSQSVTFDGTYDGSKPPGERGSLALIAGNTIKTFNVMSGTSGDGGSETQNEWTYRIEVVDPANGLTKVAYWEPNAANAAFGGSGETNAALNWFTITTVHNTTLEAPNTFSVDVLGKNTSGTTRRAKIVVYLRDGSNPDGASTAKAAIDLIQLSSSVSLSPNSVPAVAKIGGVSQAVGVQADATLKWELKTADDFKTVSGANTRGVTLVHHKATLLLADDDNDDTNDVEVTPGTDYPITQKFKVRFPKIYYPNRDIPVSASVKISIVDATGAPTELSATMTINQTTLTSPGFNVWGMTHDYYDFGEIGNTYNRGWDGNSGTWGIKQIPGYKYLGVGKVYTETPIMASANYLHATVHIRNQYADTYTWKVINDYIKGRDAWTVFQAQADTGYRPFNNPNSPFRGAGYTAQVQYGNDRNGMVDPRQRETKVFQMIFDHGNTPITNYNFTDGNNYLYIDGVNTYIDRSGVIDKSATSAVVLVSKHQGADNTPISNDAMLIIDIENKFMWMGESQMFWSLDWLTNGRSTFLDNIMYFVSNASKFGSHFTDLLLEADVPAAKQTPEIDGGRYMQPAPWDDYWGANKGVTK